MNIAGRVARTARLLGAAGFALVGCADNATEPPAVKALTAPKGIAAEKKIDLSGKPDLRATVTTEVMFRSKDGKIHKSKSTKKLKAHFKGGLARATSVAASSASNGSSGMFASLTGDVAMFAQFTSEDAVYTPVIASSSGALANNYYDAQADSVGNVYEIYGWAADYFSPPTDVWAYRNGVLIAQFHANWTQVPGGYVLADQTLGSFYEDGTVAGTIVSTVSGGGGGGGGCADCLQAEPMSGESFGDRVSAPMFAALDKLGCWLGPKSAFAAVHCFREVGVFAGETFVMGTATYYGGPFATKIAHAIAWWAGWPLWTDSMYNMLHCFDSRGERILTRGRTRCQVNPKATGCGGGGGGGSGF